MSMEISLHFLHMFRLYLAGEAFSHQGGKMWSSNVQFYFQLFLTLALHVCVNGFNGIAKMEFSFLNIIHCLSFLVYFLPFRSYCRSQMPWFVCVWVCVIRHHMNSHSLPLSIRYSLSLRCSNVFLCVLDAYVPELTHFHGFENSEFIYASHHMQTV